MTTRYLLHSIDATTYSARRKQSTGRGGTFFVLLAVISASGLLIWAENNWGWVQPRVSLGSAGEHRTRTTSYSPHAVIWRGALHGRVLNLRKTIGGI